MIIIEGTSFEKSGGYTAYLKASGTSDKKKTIIKELFDYRNGDGYQTDGIQIHETTFEIKYQILEKHGFDRIVHLCNILGAYFTNKGDLTSLKKRPIYSDWLDENEGEKSFNYGGVLLPKITPEKFNDDIIHYPFISYNREVSLYRKQSSRFLSSQRPRSLESTEESFVKNVESYQMLILIENSMVIL